MAQDAADAGFLVTAVLRERREIPKLFGLPLEALREDRGDGSVSARLIKVSGIVDQSMYQFITRNSREAVDAGANVLIFEIDSPGGLKHVAEAISRYLCDLESRKVKTVAWIPNEAMSGGAIIALSCDQIIMAPDAQLGDIGVILQIGPGEPFERAPEKVVSPFVVFVRGLAERKHRSPGLLEAMVDRNVTVFQVRHRKTGQVAYMTKSEIDSHADEWIQGPLVLESQDNRLLTLNGNRAAELGIADAPCSNVDEVRLRLSVPEDFNLQPVEQSWVDTFIVILGSGIGTFFLITLAIICVYLELHLPSGFFGIVATLLIALFFWSRFLGGTAGTLELVLFVIGLGLLAIELFLIPGFGVFGVSGILLIVGSLIMASHTFSGMTTGERFTESMSSLTSIAGAMVTVFVIGIILNRYLPSIPFLNRLILTPPGYSATASGPLLKRSLLQHAENQTPVQPGDRGIAASMLRPSGKARIGQHYVDVVSDGGFIDHNTPIEVLRVAGKRIVVRAVEPEQNSDSA
ncbi:MAG: hypothetical protein KDA96_22370, partial [Planctomycetaceae bacterium]|nr:hypothetical protein [Planctomycetaceae bacterium]